MNLDLSQLLKLQGMLNSVHCLLNGTLSGPYGAMGIGGPSDPTHETRKHLHMAFSHCKQAQSAVKKLIKTHPENAHNWESDDA